MGKLFGTDGIRGVANVPPMDSETVLRLGRAVAHVFRRRKGRHRLLIGKDTRLSGYMLETALETGIASMGVDVILLGPLPTPGVAFMTRSMRADAGVMISASHNPYEDNGLKFFGADGFKLDDETENEVERLMEPGHLDELRATPDLIGKMVRIDDAVGRYTVYLKSCIERETTLDGLKLVVDTANGAAYKVAPLVFSELGAKLITVGDRPDGTNINANCGSLYPEHISRLVKEHGAHAGIAFDGDADRVIFCDEQGKILDGDTILAMCAFDAQERGLLAGNAIVGTVMSNLGFEKALAAKGLGLVRAAVGDRYVLAEMQKAGLNIGGEQSGHLIFLDHNTTGDGILTALMVLSIMMRRGKPLSELANLFEPFPQVLLNVPVRERVPFEQLPKVQQALAGAEAKLDTNGRILLRYSGTEVKARVMVECSEQTLCDSLAAELADVIAKEIGVSR
ncbi:MAG: phosphoglucosamine mutase [Bdellovibrionales bacterium]|nr:phosphoglucosamine mutase [Bdellovibrionales bacterium]